MKGPPNQNLHWIHCIGPGFGEDTPQDIFPLVKFVHFDTTSSRTKNWYRTMLTEVYPEAMGGCFGFGLGVRCKRHLGDAESMRPKKYR